MRAVTAVDEIKKQILALGLKDRASLAEFLLGSLPPVPNRVHPFLNYLYSEFRGLDDKLTVFQRFFHQSGPAHRARLGFVS